MKNWEKQSNKISCLINQLNATSLICAVLFLASCGPSESDYKHFKTYQSADGKYVVEVALAHARMAYGPETLRLTISSTETNEITQFVPTKIANDGVPVTGANIIGEWIAKDTLQLCLRGAEQDTKSLEIKLDTASYSIKPAQCAK